MKKRSIFNHGYSISLNTFLAIGLSFFTLMSCGDDNDDVTPEENMGTLTVTPSTVVLSEGSVADNAVTLSWEFPQAGTNYVIQFSTDDNFGSKVDVSPSTNSSHTFTHATLNTLAMEDLGFTAGTAGQMNVRVKTNTADYSNVVSMTVSPYEEETENVGALTATPSTVVLSEEMAEEKAVSLSWEFPQGGADYVVQFSTDGEFGSPVEVTPSTNSSHAFTHEALNTLAMEELGFTAGTAGQMNVRVKTNAADYSNVVSMTVTPYEEPEPVYVNAWIIGNATPAEWDWEAARSLQLQQSPENDKVIFIIIDLKPGEFKIGTVHGNWNEEPFYRPAFPDFTESAVAPLTHTDVQLTIQTTQHQDHKWEVAEGKGGTYKVSINTETMTASFDLID